MCLIKHHAGCWGVRVLVTERAVQCATQQDRSGLSPVRGGCGGALFRSVRSARPDTARSFRDIDRSDRSCFIAGACGQVGQNWSVCTPRHDVGSHHESTARVWQLGPRARTRWARCKAHLGVMWIYISRALACMRMTQAPVYNAMY